MNETGTIFDIESHLFFSTVDNEKLYHIIIIIIKKGLAMQGWERVMYTLSVRRPQPHNTNL